MTEYLSDKVLEEIFQTTEAIRTNRAQYNELVTRLRRLTIYGEDKMEEEPTKTGTHAMVQASRPVKTKKSHHQARKSSVNYSRQRINLSPEQAYLLFTGLTGKPSHRYRKIAVDFGASEETIRRRVKAYENNPR